MFGETKKVEPLVQTFAEVFSADDVLVLLRCDASQMRQESSDGDSSFTVMHQVRLPRYTRHVARLYTKNDMLAIIYNMMLHQMDPCSEKLHVTYRKPTMLRRGTLDFIMHCDY